MKNVLLAALIALLLIASSLSAAEGAPGQGGYLLAEPDGDASVERTILEQFPDYTREMVEVGGQQARYLYNRVDLNGDGEDEAVVYLLGSFFCGSGGCSLLILQPAGEGFAVVNSFATSRVPVMVNREESNGWRDLVRLTSGGGAEPGYHLLQHNGEEYIEAGTTDAKTAFQGTAVLADELTFELGIPLEPRR